MKLSFEKEFVLSLQKKIQFIALDSPSSAKAFQKGILKSCEAVLEVLYKYRQSLYHDDKIYATSFIKVIQLFTPSKRNLSSCWLLSIKNHIILECKSSLHVRQNQTTLRHLLYNLLKI